MSHNNSLYSHRYLAIYIYIIVCTIGTHNFNFLLGGLASGVPGQLKGLYEAHIRFGKLPWYDVVEPSISIAREGFPITQTIAQAIAVVGPQLGDEYKTLR